MNLIEYIKYIVANCKFQVARNLALGSCFLALTLIGCTDDKLVDPSQTAENGSVTVDGDAISFTFSVPKDESTRADQYSPEYENYVDTEHKFRVFFFTEQGDFLFGAIDRTITSSTSGGITTANTYYVRVPMNYLVDREGNEYDVDAIKKYLRKNPFKIAVLANWPNNGYISAGDTDENTEDNDPNANGSGVSGAAGALRKELKGEPKWGWANSVLNPKAVPANIKNINDLHFLEDDTYASAKNDGYDFVMKDKTGQKTTKGGQTVDWVKRREVTITKGVDSYGKESWKTDAYNPIIVDIDGTDTAEEWIRTNWSPNKTWNDDGIYRQYVYLWKRWDFAGAYSCSPVASDEDLRPMINGSKHSYYGIVTGDYSAYDDDEVYGWGKDWWFRNGQELKKWMGNLGNLSMSEGDAEASFSFTPSSNSTRLKLNHDAVQGKTGVELGINQGSFTFLAHSSGRLRITFCSKNNGSTASLYANCYNPNNPSGEKTNVTFQNSTNDPSKTKTTKDLTYLDVNITGQSRKMEIYCNGGTAVIYAIEWVRAKYLYDTDREGVMVSKTNPIPMYGVADFAELTNWEDGTTFELSNGGGDYTRKNIKLVRSVAKVLLHIKKPTSGQKVKHVFMRSMNRTARCEPIDVETETATLWKDHSANDGCEWFRIRSHGILWGGSKNNTFTEAGKKDFQTWLSWFYGSWNSTRWKADYNNTTQDEEGNTILDVEKNLKANHTNYGLSPITVTTPAYPHLYNPHINRSDYCSFIEIAEDNEYQNFVLYVPDKNIDDTNTVGVPQDVPKVMHIEYRYENQSEHSLDDNDCYRVYFMNYGKNGWSESDYGKVVTGNTNYKGSTFDSFEQDVSVLQNLWPVMRNHVYEFFVGGEGPATPEVDVKVSDWGYEKVVVDW